MKFVFLIIAVISGVIFVMDGGFLSLIATLIFGFLFLAVLAVDPSNEKTTSQKNKQNLNGQCRQIIPINPKKRFCMYCGAEVDEGDTFCTECGHKVKD